MANLIKIKRSSSTAAPASLNEGELAVSFLSGKLFVGNSTAVIPIGGVHSPGTLTANQALVANATSGIDKVIVANLVPTFVYANGASGTAGQVLLSNSTGGVYWGNATSDLDSLTDVTISSASNNQILLYDSTSSQWQNHSILANSGQINLTFSPCGSRVQLSLLPDVTINSSLTVGNSTVNSVVNSTAVSTSNLAATNAITVGSNVTVNTSSFFVGNSTVNAVVNSASVTASNLAALNTIVVGSEITVNTSSFFVGNSTVNAVVNSSSLSIGNSLINATSVSVGNSSANSIINSTAVSATSLLVGSNVTVNTTSFFVGNSTVNSVVNSTFVTTTNITTNTANVTGSITVGSNVSINTSTIFIGNSTVNTTIQAGNIALRGTQISIGPDLVIDGNTIIVGNSTINTVINSTSISVDGEITSGNTNITGFINVSSTANVGGAITARGDVTVNGVLTVANTATLGNTTVNALLTIGNSTVNSVVNSTAVTTSLVSVGSNVSLSTSVLSIGNSTVNTTINSTSVSTGGLSIANLSVSGDTDLQGNVKLGNATSDVVSVIGTVNTSIIPTSNVTFSLGNNTLYWAEVHAGNVHADFGYFNQDVAIYGDLTVAGNLVTTNVQSVVISDPMIYLAGNNTSSDLVDIGFVGNYFQRATSKHAGLIRDASVDQFFLFRGLTQDLEAQLTVNTADPTFVVADLNAFLISGALVSNSLAVTITANSTVNVNITANSLSLSSALAVGSGGTGLTTVTARGILYGNTAGPLGVTAAGTDGQVLQANSTGFPVFADLDGGTF